MKKRLFRKGTLVYHHEGEQCPVYTVLSQREGKCSLALPWQPAEAVLQDVGTDELERVFERTRA